MSRLSITSIGTCRLNTPLRRAQSRYPIQVNDARVYGFTHTSDEALQQLHFLRGEKTIQDTTKRVIFRPEDETDYESQSWCQSDLTIIEISSAKKITSGADAVQINYLYRYFADFFANPKRTVRFWSMVKREQRVELAEFLAQEQSYRAMTTEDRALLRSLRMVQQDYASIYSDMAELVELLGRDRVLFATHVNALTPDGEVIPSRERLIGWVKLAAEQLGVPCFDPTQALVEFGQERAMEKGGLDLTHYTPAFSDRVYAEIHRDYVAALVAPLNDGGDALDENLRMQMMADNIEALMEFDDFFVGSRKLYSALRNHPDSEALLQLRGKILANVGDYEGAIRDLERLKDGDKLSQESRTALMQAYDGSCQWTKSLEMAEGLLGDEYESQAIYTCAATASEHLGRNAQALQFWKQAFRHDRSNLEAALRSLELLSAQGATEQLSEFSDEVVVSSGQRANGANEIGRWALEHGDSVLLAKVLPVIAAVDPSRAEVLFQGMLERGMEAEAAETLRKVHEQPTDDRKASALRQRLVDLTAAAAAKHFEQGNVRAAYLLSGAAVATAKDRNAMRTLRASVSHYRMQIKDAYRDDDFARVAEVVSEAGVILYDAIDAAVVATVSLFKLERYEEALEVAQMILSAEPDHAMGARWTGKIGNTLGRYDLAYPAYRMLREKPEAEKFHDEADRFFEIAERRAYRQMRELIENGEWSKALDIVDAMRPSVRDEERFAKEEARIQRLLRINLRENEQGDGDDETRSAILHLLLRIDGDDVAILRRAASTAMRGEQFEEAADLWERLVRLSPETEANSRNLERCRILGARQRKSTAARALANG